MRVRYRCVLLLALVVAASAHAQPAENLDRWVWDLSTIYRDQAAWEAERDAINARIDTIGRLAGTLGRNAKSLADALDQVADLRRRAGKMAIYGTLVWSADSDSTVTRMQHDVGTLLESRVEGAVGFLDDEIRALGRERIARMTAEEPRLGQHRRRIHQILRESGHTPPAAARAAVESLRRWQSTPDLAWWALIESNLDWPAVRDAAGKEVGVNRSAFLRTLNNVTDADVRRRTADAYLGKLQSMDGLFAVLLTRRIEAELEMARHRNLGNGADAFLWRDGFPPETRTAMFETTRANLAVFHRFLRLRGQLNGLEKQSYFDLRIAPPIANRLFTVSETMNIAVDLAAAYGPEFQARMRERLRKPWYHLAATPGKRDSYGVWYTTGGIAPFGIITYTGTASSSSDLTGLLFGMMLFAETPSSPGPDTRHDPPVFANMNLNAARIMHGDYLRTHTTDRNERIAYLVRSLDTLRNLYFRDVLAADFEWRLHQRVAAGEIPDAAEISKLYLQLLREFYGHDQGVVHIPDIAGAEWMNLPNLYYGSDFQGFPLATAAAALLVEKLQAGDTKARRSMSVLERTDTNLSYDLMRESGVDMATRAPYEAVARRVKALTDELETLMGRSARAEQPPAQSESSYREARRVLDAAVRAYGGAAQIEAARDFTLTMRGRTAQLFQAPDPEQPFVDWPFERSLTMEESTGRVHGDERLQKPGSDYYVHVRTLIDGGKGHEIDRVHNTAITVDDAPLPSFRSWLQLLPHFFVREASARASTLRSLGKVTIRDRACDAITYSTSSGQQLTLFFDADSHLLLKQENLYVRNASGDSAGETFFLAHRASRGTQVPTRRLSYQSGYFGSDAEYLDVAFGRHPDPKRFEMPAGVRVLTAFDAEPAVQKLARDVYLLHDLPGGYNLFFVAFDDHINVFEAPEGNTVSGISDRAVAMIKKTVPGKPIRRIVLTHHHGDHASGLRAFVAEGAAVVTTPGSRKFVERVAAAPFTIQPDALAKNPKPLSLEMIENKRHTLRDANHHVELYEIGPLEHAKEMVIVHLPKEKILFQSDLLNPLGSGAISRDWFGHGVDGSDTKKLVSFLSERKLDVETIAPSHGTVAKFADLLRAAAQ